MRRSPCLQPEIATAHHGAKSRTSKIHFKRQPGMQAERERGGGGGAESHKSLQ